MIRRIALTTAFVLALGGCATYDSANHAAYRDGGYGGNYDGGYYSAPADGYGDYYYDRPEVVVDYGAGFGGPYASYGFGFGYAPWGFGYDPWFYRPWWGDGDGDADDWHHHRPGHRPGPNHHALPVGIDRRVDERRMFAAPIRQSNQDRAPPDMGRRADGGRDREERTRPPHQLP